MLLLMLVLVAGVHGLGLIRSRAHCNGLTWCMRTPNDSNGAAIQLLPCDPLDERQWWESDNAQYQTLTAWSNGMQMTMRNSRDRINNVVEQRKNLPDLSQWQWDNSGRMKWVMGKFGPSRLHSLQASFETLQVVLRRHHHGKRQFWDFVPVGQAANSPPASPQYRQQEQQQKAEQALAQADEWLRRFNRGRRRLAGAPESHTGRLLAAIEE